MLRDCQWFVSPQKPLSTVAQQNKTFIILSFGHCLNKAFQDGNRNTEAAGKKTLQIP